MSELAALTMARRLGLTGHVFRQLQARGHLDRLPPDEAALRARLLELYAALASTARNQR